MKKYAQVFVSLMLSFLAILVATMMYVGDRSYNWAFPKKKSKEK